MIDMLITKIILKYKKDEMVLDILSTFIKRCGDYVNVVNKEAALALKKSAMDQAVFVGEMTKIDSMRRIIHDTIINDYKLIHRLAEVEYVEIDRSEIGDIAFRIVEKNFKNRRR